MEGIMRRMPHLFKAWVIIFICAMVAFGMCAICFSAPAQTEAPVEMDAQEKQNLVQQGVALYKQGKHEQAQKNLELAKTEFPENYAVPYYLGLIYLEQGERSAAIAQWQQYVRMDPDSENALNIRKNITRLLLEQSREFAIQAVATEATVASGSADDETIAVTTFNNLGSENLGPIGKGLAAMIITDLSQVSGLTVVDRIKLHALLEEINLGTSGLVDQKTAPRVGKLLKAKHVTSGSLADLEEENLMVASVVVDTDKRASIGDQEAQGELKQFYDLEKQIACQIIEDLGRDCKNAPAAFHKIHTKSMPALVLYSWGLEHFDAENYDQAREMFQKALQEDPQFDLAAAALVATPTSVVMSLTRSQMISGASSSGPSSAGAGTAVASTSTTSTAAASSVAAGTVGISPTTAIIGGTVLAGGAAAAGGGGGGDGGGGGTPQSLSGDWVGTWADSTGESGEVTLNLTQTGDAVTGTVAIPGDPCLPTGDVFGTVSGNIVALTIQSGAEIVTINDGSVDYTANTFTGTWNYTASGLPDCIDTGNFSASQTGGAVIRW